MNNIHSSCLFVILALMSTIFWILALRIMFNPPPINDYRTSVYFIAYCVLGAVLMIAAFIAWMMKRKSS